MEASSAAGSQQASSSHEEVESMNVETMMNLTLLDPPRWGWSAAGGVVDVLPPHERARRSSTRAAFLRQVSQHEQARKNRTQQDGSGMATGTEQVTPTLMARQRGAPSGLPFTPMASRGTVDKQGPSVPEHTVNGPQEVVNYVKASVSRVTLAAAAAASGGNGQGEAAMADVTEGSTDAQITSALQAIGTSLLPGNLAHSESAVARMGNSARSGSNMEASAPQSTNRRGREPRIIDVTALKDDGVLDAHTYHRGIEGSEPRDEETGSLLCDVEQTDTSHKWEPPDMKLLINVVFPLSDDNNPNNGETNAAKNAASPVGNSDQHPGVNEANVPYYGETVEWNLADPRTQTPMSFAAGISEEFGLNADQTLQLATSIQEQIDDFVQRKASFKSPLTVLDPNGIERCNTSAHPPSLRGPPQLFGSAIGTTQPGMPMPPRKRYLQPPSTRETFVVSDRRRNSKRVRSPTDVDPVYKEEVRRRAREASAQEIKRIWEEEHREDPVGILKDVPDAVCHICHSRRLDCKDFPCPHHTHSMCDTHIASMGMDVVDSDGQLAVVEYCPICSLMCECAKCERRLVSVSYALMNKCEEQGKPPNEALFDDILKACVARKKSKERQRNSDSVDSADECVVSVKKVPPHEFPREVCNGKDLDPGTSDDYRTVHTIEGSFLTQDPLHLDSHNGPTGDEVQEDGNVDYCNECKKHGNLLCCDICPRAYHPECITSDKPDDKMAEGSWECVMCCKEKKSSEDEIVDGNSSVEVVVAPFAKLVGADGDKLSFEILSRIHETVMKLMKYDFGYMFSKPVDAKSVPGYTELVKNPMDLGTIAARLADEKGYAEIYRLNESWEDVIATVLNDIELVWHNCFTFNLEGSAVYRMAEVQRRKYERTKNRSFADLLSEQVKQRVNAFVAQCEQERNKVARIVTPPSQAIVDARVSGRNKITVPHSMKGGGRVIAVLDPDTGLVVKMYTTQKAATLAARFLARLGYDAEIPTISDSAVKEIFRRGSQEPTRLLFGYRWIFMDELVRRKVRFPFPVKARAVPSGVIEMKNEGITFLFLSIDEASKWNDLPKDIPSKEIRDKLCQIPVGEWRTIAGCMWKRLAPKKSTSVVNARPEDLFPEDVQVLKEDCISRRIMMGLKSVTDAHCDWIKTREGSIMPPSDEPTDMDYFASKYLDGNKNVDGIIWRTRKVPPATNEQKEPPGHSQPQGTADQSVTISEPGTEIETDRAGECTPHLSNGEAPSKLGDIPTSPKGADAKAGVLNPAPKTNREFPVLGANGLNSNSSLLDSVKRDRDATGLASKPRKKRAIYS